MIKPIGSDAMSVALWGIRDAHSRMLEAARSVATDGSDAYPDAFLEMIQAKHSHAANIKVVQSQQEMDDALLDIVA